MLLWSATASAGPLAQLDQDLDGDGKVDRVVVDRATLTITGSDKAVIELKGEVKAARLAAGTVAGVPTIAAAITTGSGEQTLVVERHGGWTRVIDEPTGPVPPDGDYSIAIAPGPNGLYRYQQRPGLVRCDGKPAFLYAEGWHDKKWRRLSKLPIEVDDHAPVLVAKPDPTSAPAPLEFQLRGVSYEPGAANASELALPAELYDGKPSTYWHEDLASSGEGQFFTITSRAASTKAVQIRIQAAAGKGLDRAKRIAIVGDKQAWHADLADTDAAQVIDLPQPIDGCVTVVIEDAYGPRAGATLAIGELAVYGEGERAGGGEAALAKAIADDRDIESATQALSRRGAAAVTALDGELQHASSVAVRTRLILAIAQVRDPAARPIVAQAIAKGQVDERQLDQVLAALGASGVFAPELHDLLAKKQLAQAHRAAAAAALADSVAHAKSDPALLLDLAGDGDLAQRRAIIAGLATLPVGTLLAAAQAATAPEAAGDLYRATTRRARTAPAEAPPALAAFVAALAAATDYERRYRLVDGIASLGDAPALAALAQLIQSLPAGSARSAFDQVAARAIAKAPRPEALDLLLLFLREPDPGVRYAALSALGATEGGTPGPWHRAVDSDGVDRVIQTTLASDTWPEVRARAAEMLGARCSRPGPAKSLDAAVHRDPELAVRSDALAALVECKATGASELLAQTWDNRRQPIELRQRAVDLAAELGDRALAAKLVGKLTQWRGAALDSADALALAQNAAYAVGKLAPPGAAEALLAALDDGAFPEVVAAAATGLGLMGRACPALARPKLRSLARSEEQQIALAASHAAALCGK